MVRQLKFDEFVHVAKVFAKYGPNQPVIDACIAGRNPCEIWLNDENPEACLTLISKFGFAFGWGDIQGILQKTANSRKKELIFVPAQYAAPEFGESFVRWEYKNYEEREFISDLLKNVPSNLSWVELNEKNAAKSNWKDVILSLYDDFASFQRSGGGLALSNGSEYLAESMIGFKGNEYAEICTVTHPDHREKGYSTLVCAQFMKNMMQKNLKPYWSCNESNQASVCVAEKLGFDYLRSYTVSRISPR